MEQATAKDNSRRPINDNSLMINASFLVLLLILDFTSYLQDYFLGFHFTIPHVSHQFPGRDFLLFNLHKIELTICKTDFCDSLTRLLRRGSCNSPLSSPLAGRQSSDLRQKSGHEWTLCWSKCYRILHHERLLHVRHWRVGHNASMGLRLNLCVEPCSPIRSATYRILTLIPTTKSSALDNIRFCQAR